MAGGKKKSLCEKKGDCRVYRVEKESSHCQEYTGNACMKRATERFELDWICPTMRDYFDGAELVVAVVVIHTRNYSIQTRFSTHSLTHTYSRQRVASAVLMKLPKK